MRLRTILLIILASILAITLLVYFVAKPLFFNLLSYTSLLIPFFVVIIAITIALIVFYSKEIIGHVSKEEKLRHEIYKKSKEVPKEINKEIVNYIKAMRESGQGNEAILEALKETTYGDREIADALTYVDSKS